MFRVWSLLTIPAVLLWTTSFVNADGLYVGKSPVLQLTAKTYDSLIAQSNHTSIVEFYAPWCGHCQSLKPAYEKAAKNLAGLAKVAAINCDDESNKPLCGQFGVQGFPTLKIVKPGKKPGKPIVEDYQGPRTAKGIVDAVTDKIPNHVKRLQEATFSEWVEDKSTGSKVLLFTEKGTTGSLIKALAIDFLGSISFAQIRDKEKSLVEKYGVTEFPSIVLVPGGNQSPVFYDGDMKKEALIEFLSQVATPNPDPAPKKARTADSKNKAKKSAKASSTVTSKFSEASEAHKSADFNDYMEHASTVILGDDTPIESPMPIVDFEEKPMVITDIPKPLAKLETASELEAACLGRKTGNCVLILTPKEITAESTFPEAVEQALARFADLADRQHKRKANAFPFYAIPNSNLAAADIRQSLKLSDETHLEIIAVNMKRGWWKLYAGNDYGLSSVEGFVDAIKFGEGKKEKLPANFFSTSAEPAVPEPEPIAEPDITLDAETTVAEPEPSPEPAIHDEL